MTEVDIESDIQKAVAVLKNGGLLLYPTDTIWGIGCDATNSEAISKIYEIKKRKAAKAMISLVDSIESLHEYVEEFPVSALDVLKSAVRPTSVILNKTKGISSLLKAEDGSAAFRIPNNDYTKRLCTEVGFPIVSTSANFSGDPSPLSFQDIKPELFSLVDYVCVYGREFYNDTPSRILKFETNGEVTVIRD